MNNVHLICPNDLNLYKEDALLQNSNNKYYGTLRNGSHITKVVVKKVPPTSIFLQSKVEDDQNQTLNSPSVTREILKHPNILKYLGYVNQLFVNNNTICTKYGNEDNSLHDNNNNNNIINPEDEINEKSSNSTTVPEKVRTCWLVIERGETTLEQQLHSLQNFLMTTTMNSELEHHSIPEHSTSMTTSSPISSTLPTKTSLSPPKITSVSFLLSEEEEEEEERRLKESLNLGFQEKLEILIEILKGISYLHEHGVVHGDLRPSSVKRVKNTFKLSPSCLYHVIMQNDSTDICVISNSDKINLQTIVKEVVSPLYVAPEIITSEQPVFTPQSDMYAFGVIFLEVMLLEPPNLELRSQQLQRTIDYLQSQYHYLESDDENEDYYYSPHHHLHSKNNLCDETNEDKEGAEFLQINEDNITSKVIDKFCRLLLSDEVRSRPTSLLTLRFFEALQMKFNSSRNDRIFDDSGDISSIDVSTDLSLGITGDISDDEEYDNISVDHDGRIEDMMRNISKVKLSEDDSESMYEKGLLYKQQQKWDDAFYCFAKVVASTKHAAAKFQLALCYEEGHGTERNIKKAKQLCFASANQKNSDALNHLGYCYQKGVSGFKMNTPKALKYYQLAADHNHASAQYNLGYCFQTGIGTEINPPKAFKYYQMAANQPIRSYNAQYALASCYENGFGTAVDHHRAFLYYQLAADQGYANAQFSLAECYQNGIGTARDPALAFEFYQLAAKQKNADAQNALGYCYQHGIGTLTDPSLAFSYYQMAANQSLPSAQYNLANCYQKGIGVVANLSHAAKYYKLAADNGHSNAQNNLAYYYQYGIGVDAINLPLAIHYYTLAVAQNNPYALCNLGDCLQSGSGTEKDLKKAAEYYHRSATQFHNPDAQFRLAECYELGVGVPKDRKKAIEFYRLAADQGHSDAFEKLQVLLSIKSHLESNIKSNNNNSNHSCIIS